MTTHFKPANTAIQEMKPWELEGEPPRFQLFNPNAKYAVIMVMAGDDEKLGGQVLPDIGEMIQGIVGGDEVSVLLLADMLGHGAAIFEVTPKGPIELASRASLDTGDPRPLSSFLAIALSSFSKETRIALGFWGHGSGVFGDLDPHENLIPDALMELPLGKRITETMFLENYLAEPMPIKSLFTRGMLPDASTGGILTNRELSSALAVAFSRAGRTEPVDLMFFDTCQNGAVEVYAEMKRYCKTFVASCLVVPGMGWNYTWFLQMTRQGLPRTAADWGKLAIAAFDKTYDQSLYPTPVQLVAIDSNANFLEKLQVIAQRLKEMDSDTRAELMQCSQNLDAVAHDESVDMCSLILALKKATTDDALVAACDDFSKAYSDSVIAISAPANDGKAYHGLSLWCPRMGDAVSVSKYYQNLRFHKETGWFDVIKEMVKDEAPRRADPIFMILSFQGLELLEAREVKTTVLDPDDHGMHHLLLSIPEKSKPWSGNLTEGLYRYKTMSKVAFPSVDHLKAFLEFMDDIRRKKTEFSILEAACRGDLVLDTEAAERLTYEFMKYERIVIDEFPEKVGAYMALRNQARRATKGALLLGRAT